MPTIPPEQARPFETHRQRQVAESFGSDAGRYDRARPSYPGALVDRIVAASPGRDVLDVGCGTGIAARLFQAAGCRVLGVDPDERMASVARQAGLEARGDHVRGLGRGRAGIQRGHRRAGLALGGSGGGRGERRARAAARRPAGGVLERGAAAAGTGCRVRRGLPRRAAGPAVQPVDAARPRGLPVHVRQGRRRHQGSGRLRRARTVALRLGPPVHPRRVAGPGADHGRPRPAPAGQAGQSCWPAWAQRSTRSAAVSR